MSNCAFPLQGAAPGVKGVVHHHPVLEHRVIVREIGREPERKGEESGRLRRKFETCRIGAAHDQLQPVEAAILDAIDLEKRIEAAELAACENGSAPGMS